MRKVIYVLSMILLTGLLFFGAYTAGTVLNQNIGFDGSLSFTVLSTLLIIAYVSRKKKTPHVSKLSLTTLMTLSLLGQIVLFLLLLAMILLYGATPQKGSIFMPALGAYVIYCYVSTVFMTFDTMMEGNEVDRNEYPALFSTIDDAVKASSLPKGLSVRLFFRANVTISAIRYDNELRILIGTHIPAIMNHYELESLLTAELELIIDHSPSVDVDLRRRLFHWQAAVKNDVMPFPNLFIVNASTSLLAKAEAALLSCVKDDEKRRIHAIKQYGVPSDYIGAYAKLLAYDLFLYSPGKRNPYEGELPPQDFQESMVQEYRAFIHESMPLFSDAVCHHRPFQEAISLSGRMKELGIDTFTLPRQEWNPPYVEECEHILKIGNDDFAADFEANYSAKRAEHYLAPKAVAEHYLAMQQAGTFLSETEILEAVSAFRAIGATAKAESILDELLEASPNHALAAEEKGHFLLERYDPAGIGYLETAMRANDFSEERNLHAIRRFYQKIGNTEQELAITTRDDSARAREQDRYRLFQSLNRAECFTAPLLPPDTLCEITDEIRARLGQYLDTAYLIGCREEALHHITYLVIKLKGSSPLPEVEVAMKRLWLYFDNRPEPFCLLSLEDKPVLEELAPSIVGIVIIKPPEQEGDV